MLEASTKHCCVRKIHKIISSVSLEKISKSEIGGTFNMVFQQKKTDNFIYTYEGKCHQ